MAKAKSDITLAEGITMIRDREGDAATLQMLVANICSDKDFTKILNLVLVAYPKERLQDVITATVQEYMHDEEG